MEEKDKRSYKMISEANGLTILADDDGGLYCIEAGNEGGKLVHNLKQLFPN